MKGAVIAVVCAIALTQGATVVNQNGCPLDFSIDKLLPHPSCGQYFQCVHGALQERFCPSGLHFSPVSLACDFPIAANCEGKFIVPENPIAELESNNVPSRPSNDPSQAPAICAASDSDGLLVAHEICNRFYKCSFGLPVTMRCPSTLYYDTNEERCEWPNTVECGNRLIPDEDDNNSGGDWTGDGAGNDDPSKAPAICAAEGSDHSYIAHEYCDKYYQCWDGKPVALYCPEGLLFDPSKDYCDWPYQVDCGNRLISEGGGSGGGGGDNQGGGSYETEKVPEGAGNDDPSQAGNICKGNDSEGVLVAHEDCSKYYICNFGYPVVQNCSVNLLFDPTRDRCEWRDIVKCGTRFIPDEVDNDEWTGGGAGNDDPSQAAAICAAEGSDHVYIAHETCSKFYQCWAGKPVALDCPAGFYFNAKVDYCDFPVNVNCNRRLNLGQLKSNDGNDEEDIPVGGNNNDPSQAYDICKGEESEGVMVAHENCNQFYVCNFGSPVVRSCSVNLLFDPTRDRCEWRGSFDCNGRIIPDEVDIEEWTPPSGAENDDPSQAAAICAAEGSDQVYIAHEICSKFYQCWAGKPIALDCPAGFYFNAKVDYCDFPANVDCANRVM